MANGDCTALRIANADHRSSDEEGMNAYTFFRGKETKHESEGKERKGKERKGHDDGIGNEAEDWKGDGAAQRGKEKNRPSVFSLHVF